MCTFVYFTFITQGMTYSNSGKLNAPLTWIFRKEKNEERNHTKSICIFVLLFMNEVEYKLNISASFPGVEKYLILSSVKINDQPCK